MELFGIPVYEYSFDLPDSAYEEMKHMFLPTYRMTVMIPVPRRGFSRRKEFDIFDETFDFDIDEDGNMVVNGSFTGIEI